MLLALLLVVACAPSEETATAAAEPWPDPADSVFYVPAGAGRVLEVHDWTYTAACDDADALVVRVGDLLCSVTGDGRVLDADGDGVCELSPPVDLAISVWR